MKLLISDVARIFGVSENTVARWVRQENLPVHVINSQYRFDRAELIEWAATNHIPLKSDVFHRPSSRAVHGALSKAMERGGVAANIVADQPSEIFRKGLADAADWKGASLDEVVELMEARQRQGGVFVGDGIAVPHPRLPVVIPGGESLLRTCYLAQPWDVPTPDGVPVDTLFLLLAPTVHAHLQLLARLTSILFDEEFRRLLKRRPDKTRLLAAVRAFESVFEEREQASGAKA